MHRIRHKSIWKGIVMNWRSFMRLHYSDVRSPQQWADRSTTYHVVFCCQSPISMWKKHAICFSNVSNFWRRAFLSYDKPVDIPLVVTSRVRGLEVSRCRGDGVWQCVATPPLFFELVLNLLINSLGLWSKKQVQLLLVALYWTDISKSLTQIDIPRIPCRFRFVSSYARDISVPYWLPLLQRTATWKLASEGYANHVEVILSSSVSR